MHLNKLAFFEQFGYGVFWAYVRLREQEIRNIVWIAECIAQVWIPFCFLCRLQLFVFVICHLTLSFCRTVVKRFRNIVPPFKPGALIPTEKEIKSDCDWIACLCIILVTLAPPSSFQHIA